MGRGNPLHISTTTVWSLSPVPPDPPLPSWVVTIGLVAFSCPAPKAVGKVAASGGGEAMPLSTDGKGGELSPALGF